MSTRSQSARKRRSPIAILSYHITGNNSSVEEARGEIDRQTEKQRNRQTGYRKAERYESPKKKKSSRHWKAVWQEGEMESGNLPGIYSR